MQEILHKQCYVINRGDNSGESISLETTWYENGDFRHGLPAGIFTNQKIILNSYCNSASINLCGSSISPNALRDLADELEKGWKLAKENLSRTVE